MGQQEASQDCARSTPDRPTGPLHRHRRTDCQFTPVNVPLVYGKTDPPLYGQSVPGVYGQYAPPLYGQNAPPGTKGETHIKERVIQQERSETGLLAR